MIKRVAKLLNRCGDRASVMPPTELYNEGWLLRIALDWFGTDGPSDSQFSFSSGAAWYSEGRLASRFLARSRSDKKAEGFTHADGTIGHFSVSPGERSEIVPTADATQLVVIEAKLGSPLSSGTTNAPGYDQAARTAACLVHIASKAKVEPSSLTHYGFYVVAPEAQIKAGVFASLVTKESIEEKVRRRAVRFEGEEATEWIDKTFMPYFAALKVGLISWEQIIAQMGAGSFASEYRRFYEMCCSFVPRLRRATSHTL